MTLNYHSGIKLGFLERAEKRVLKKVMNGKESSVNGQDRNKAGMFRRGNIVCVWCFTRKERCALRHRDILDAVFTRPRRCLSVAFSIQRSAPS